MFATIETPVETLIETINARLKEKILKWLPQHELISTPIDGVMFGRQNETTKTENCFYQPTAALVIQGTKRSRIGSVEYCYKPYHYMVAGVDMPSTNYIVDATPDKPFLAISIKLDRYLIAQLMAEIAFKPVKNKNDSNVVIVEKASYELLDAFWRLVELLDNPARIPVLAPMIMREIHYLLLTGPQG